MTIYNKLVRDKIPEICLKSGFKPHTHIIKGLDLIDALKEKLVEEANEAKANPVIEELADVSEVVISLGKQLGYSAKQIEAMRIKKSKERGGFKKGIFLEKTEKLNK